ncbi:uncharacterized protein SAPINGB_P003936 [Magnusiomyces paraingens]|uniref:Uncharacterized protein n=1 Tax=Magnusiomyces paraingens TaxID=2606893 RepID=A0A5E8BU55_9ASCO|nr:uncharacterized protein SAPINGB_P003936 [Saprochaete ingens]VVT54159.1 unnamed protein product [Saprochaete ingens]
MGKLGTSKDSLCPQTKAESSKVSGKKETFEFSRANSSLPITTKLASTTTTTTSHALSDLSSQQNLQSQMSSLLGFSASPSFPATIFSTNNGQSRSSTPEQKEKEKASPANNNSTTILPSESLETLLDPPRSDGAQSNSSTDTSPAPSSYSSLSSTRNISTALSIMSSEQGLKDDQTNWSAAQIQKESPPPPPQNEEPQTPPRQQKTPAETASSTPTLRDRLSEKTALIFNTISAVNNSKDKRAAVNEVVADITSHVRSKSINSLSSLAGGLGSWAVPTAVTASDSETAKTDASSGTELLEIPLKKRDNSVFATSPSISTFNEQANTSFKSGTDNDEDTKELGDDGAGYYSDVNRTGVANPYTGSVEVSSESSVVSSTRTTVPGTPRVVDVSAKYERYSDTPKSAGKISPKVELKNTPQGVHVNTGGSVPVKSPASAWKRETDQSFHILTLGLAQLNKDPQLGRALTVHGLGRLAGAVLSELEKGSDGTQKLSEHEHEQMLVTCLTPLMRGRTFSVQMDPEKPGTSSVTIEEASNGRLNGDEDISQVLSALKESPARRNSMDTSSDTLVQSSKQTTPLSGKRVRRLSHPYGSSPSPPPVYEPQNFAERFVVTSVRSGCLAFKTAAPYAKELIGALAAEERRLRILEKLGTLAINAIRIAFFAAVLITSVLKKVLLDSEFGRRIGKSLQGLLLAFVVGLSQSMIIMAAGINNNDGGRWKGDYYYDGDEYEDCEQYEDESVSGDGYEEDEEEEDDDDDDDETTRVQYQEDSGKDSWWTTALKMGNASGMPILSSYTATFYPEKGNGVSSGSSAYSQSNPGQSSIKRRTQSRLQKERAAPTQQDTASGLVTPSSSVIAAAGWTMDQLDKLWATYNAQQAQAQFHQQRQQRRSPIKPKRANGSLGAKTYGPKRS